MGSCWFRPVGFADAARLELSGDRRMSQHHHPYVFHDFWRGCSATLVGIAITLVSLAAGFKASEAVTMAILVAMLQDLARIAWTSVLLDARLSRRIFGSWNPNRTRLLQRTVFLAFVSVVVLSMCVHDVKSSQPGLLPQVARISLFFAALFATWLQLHLGYALFYAKLYFARNPAPAASGDSPQVFIFPGSDEPLFTDFLYISYSVALTFAMSDVDLEDGLARRVVLLQALTSFLFYSIIFSMVTNLMVS